MSVRVLLLALSFLALAFIFLVPNPGVQAKTVGVDEHGGEEYTNISRAIENSTAGDTIIVKPGNYSFVEQMWKDCTLKTNMTLRGAGPERCNLSLNFRTHIVTLSPSKLTLSGFTLNCDSDEAGLFYLQGNNITITNCSFNKNWDTILLVGDNATISNCIFSRDCNTIYFSPESADINFTGNQLTTTFLYLSTLYSSEAIRTYDLSNNSYDGRPLHYLVDKRDKVITQGDGGYILVGCENISFENIQDGGGSGGIHLISCSDIRVLNCSLPPGSCGLRLADCQEVLVKNCTLNGAGPGFLGAALYSENSHNVSILNNIFPTGGIYMMGYGAGTAIIQDNRLEGTSSDENPSLFCGMVLYQYQDSIVTGNTMNQDGLILSSSISWSEDDTLSWYSNTVVENNSLGGRPIYYHVNRSGEKVAEDAAQVYLINCQDMEVSKLVGETPGFLIHFINTSNSRVRDINILEHGGSLKVRYSSNNNRFENITLAGDDNWFYVRLWDSDNNLFANCSFSGNNATNGRSTDTGMYIRGSTGTIIRNNTIKGNDDCGLNLNGAVSGTIIVGNDISNNLYGLHIHSVDKGNLVISNNIHHNRKFGFWYEGNLFRVYNNWWGSASGPHNRILNPKGTGDNISEDLTLLGWATEPVVWDGSLWMPSRPDLPPDDESPEEEDEEASLADNLCLGAIFIVAFGLLAAILGSILLPDNFFAFLRPEAGVSANGSGLSEAGKENDREPEKEKLTKEEPEVPVEEPGKQVFLSQEEVDNKKKSTVDVAPAQEARKDAGPLCLSCPLCGARFNVEQGAGALKTRCPACHQEVRLECL